MLTCKQCGKKVGLFSSKTDFWGNRFCDEKCLNQHKGIKKTDKEMKASGKVKEFQCKCNKCNKVWHYLEEEEKKIRSQIGWSGFGMMTCCLPIQLYSKQEAGKWEQKLDKFKKCPKCGSHDITKKAIYYEKKA